MESLHIYNAKTGVLLAKNMNEETVAEMMNIDITDLLHSLEEHGICETDEFLARWGPVTADEITKLRNELVDHIEKAVWDKWYSEALAKFEKAAILALGLDAVEELRENTFGNPTELEATDELYEAVLTKIDTKLFTSMDELMVKAREFQEEHCLEDEEALLMAASCTRWPVRSLVAEALLDLAFAHSGDGMEAPKETDEALSAKLIND